jgi:hypothetical protein
MEEKTEEEKAASLGILTTSICCTIFINKKRNNPFTDHSPVVELKTGAGSRAMGVLLMYYQGDTAHDEEH